MAGAHAKESPSGAEGWINCSDWASDSGTNGAAEAGTARHEFVALLLEGKEVARMQESVDAPGYHYDEDVAADVKVAYDNVISRIENFKMRGALLVEMFIEMKLDIGHITGTEGATGTSDVVLVITWPDHTLQIDVIDHKFGYRAVSATDNKQGRMYLLGAVHWFGITGEVTKVSFAINQPQSRPTINDAEWTIEELQAFGAEAALAAGIRRMSRESGTPVQATPGPHCDKTYCSKRATCPALKQMVIDSFDAVPDVMAATEVELADSMTKVDMIESWCSAVRGAVYGTLNAGGAIPGYKLVQGKRGHRAWSSAEQAEATLKAMGVKKDDMYDLKVISPATAEKLAAAKIIGPRQWPKVKALITQPDGKPTVVPASDKRDAIVISAVDDFDVVTDETCDLA